MKQLWAARYDSRLRIAGGSAGVWHLETGRITLKVAPSEKEGWLDSHSSEVVPCSDRPVTIDLTPKTQ